MTEDVLKAVEPMPNDMVIDLTVTPESTPQKRKLEANDRSSVTPSDTTLSERGVENVKKTVKRSKKTDEEKEAARLLKEQKHAEKEQKTAEKEQKAAEKEQKAAAKEAELKAKAAEKEARQAERDAKAAEKAQQLAMKAEKEREKAALAEQEEKAKAKQKNVMASFFGKKPERQTSPIKQLISRSSPAGPSRTKSPERQPSPEKIVGTDYERTFKSPILRSNTKWAETNRWFGPNHVAQPIPEDELAKWGREGSPAVRSWTSKEFINEHLSRHQVKPAKRRRLPNGLKTAPPAASVGEVWAEYLRSDNPREVLGQLKDPERYPWKTLSFHHENRPPYRGTWTKRSVCVGPRTPFGQDPTIDYAYDSDAEWVEDEGDADDAAEAADEEEEEDDEDMESEGEFDDWLDDSKDVVKKKIGKRKFAEIVPTWAGPLWEDKLGKGTSGMEEYRIRCLNDTPLHSIDPFTWVSEYPEQRYKADYAIFAADNGDNVKCIIKARRIAGKKAVVKAEEPEPASTKPSDPFAAALKGSAASSVTAPSVKAKTPAAPPPFPSLYLPQFLQIVSGSTQSEADLLAALKTEIPFASKATLKAKLKETAQKLGSKKDVKWVIKKEASPKAVEVSSSDLPPV